MTTVVAGILEKDGRILACRRRLDQEHAGKWEFPGGKVEARETPQEALRRELREELRIEVRVGLELDRYQFTYLGREPIVLAFFEIEEYEGELDVSQFDETRWARLEELRKLDFLAGDEPFLARWAARAGNAAERQAQ